MLEIVISIQFLQYLGIFIIGVLVGFVIAYSIRAPYPVDEDEL